MRSFLLLSAAGGAFARTGLIIGALAVGVFARMNLVHDSNIVADKSLLNIPALPTQDYFEITTPDYNYTGLLLLPQFRASANSRSCTLAFNRTGDSHIIENDVKDQYHTSIIGISWDAAAAAQCTTYAQVANAAAAYANGLEITNYPEAKIVLIFTTKEEGITGDFSGPYSDPYSSLHLIDDDTSPEFQTALVPTFASDNIYARLKQAQVPIVVDVVKEMGKWNTIFLNQDFVTFRYVACVFSSVLTLISAARFMKQSSAANYSVQPLQLSQILAIVACFSIMLPLRTVTATTYLLRLVDGLIYGISFYLQLMLWHRTAREMTKKTNTSISCLFFTCQAALAIEVFCFIAQIVDMSTSNNNTHAEAMRIASGGRVALLCLYVIIAIILIVIGMANKELQGTADMVANIRYKRFNKIARLALPGFLYMIAQAVFASLFLSHQANYDAHGHMAAFTFLVVSGMLRCLGAVPFMGLGDPISLDKLALSRKSVMSKGTDTASDVDSVAEKPRFDVEIENAAKQTTTWQQLFNCRIDSP